MVDKRQFVESEGCGLSIVRQCELLGLPRSTYYYEPATESEDNLALIGRLEMELDWVKKKAAQFGG